MSTLRVHRRYTLFKVFMFLLSLAAFSTLAWSQVQAESFYKGQELQHMLDICVEKNDALEVVNTEAKEGFEAAQAMWMAKDACGTEAVSGPIVGKVVHTVNVVRRGKPLVSKVIEILSPVDDKVLAYFITTLPVTNKSDGSVKYVSPIRS